MSDVVDSWSPADSGVSYCAERLCQIEQWYTDWRVEVTTDCYTELIRLLHEVTALESELEGCEPCAMSYGHEVSYATVPADLPPVDTTTTSAPQGVSVPTESDISPVSGTPAETESVDTTGGAPPYLSGEEIVSALYHQPFRAPVAALPNAGAIEGIERPAPAPVEKILPAPEPTETIAQSLQRIAEGVGEQLKQLFFPAPDYSGVARKEVEEII